MPAPYWDDLAAIGIDAVWLMGVWRRSPAGIAIALTNPAPDRVVHRGRVGDRVLANGRDPYFPAWPDVLQLNVFEPQLRTSVTDALNGIADQCDGVRCDMAMLVLNDVFARTWRDRVGDAQATDYWTTIIPAVHAHRPGFVFLAEAYWDLEWTLQQQGFDFCYDKRLCDRLLHGPASISPQPNGPPHW